MRNSIKMPLSTYVLFHSDFKDGEKCFDMIYRLLCRDIDKPLIDGIDIPVYLRTGNDKDCIPDIDCDNSDYTAIILLIDSAMYCSDKWREYIDCIVEKTNSKIKLYAIGFYEHAFEINEKAEKIQAIKLEGDLLNNNIKLIQTRLLESLFRQITTPEEKISLFISHAKKDGEAYAKSLRDYLRKETKLNSFFDENDILDGNSFEHQLEKNVQRSLLVILKTEIYSEREWCRIEAAIAKKHDIPTILVNCVKKQVKRTFPYIGNCPMIQYNDDWTDMIIMLLKASLNQEYQKKLLSVFKKKSENSELEISEIIPHAPELFSFINLAKNTELNILYPEPPLGNEEMNILNSLNEKVHFFTPAQSSTKQCDFLNYKQIAISISEADDISAFGCSKTTLRDFTLELSRHILIAGSKLVYGGDLRKDGYTELFKDLSYQYGKLEKTVNNVRYFTNYFAWPISNKLDNCIRTDFIHNRVKIVEVEPPSECTSEDKDKFIAPDTLANNYLWAKSLTKMREEMENSVNARIILGGRLTGFNGKYAGILEEFLIAKKQNHPIYLLGGFGGASKAISDIIENKENCDTAIKEALSNTNYKEFIEYYNVHSGDKIDYDNIINELHKCKISDLNNGLDENENEILMHSTNILELIILILKGLNKTFES